LNYNNSISCINNHWNEVTGGVYTPPHLSVQNDKYRSSATIFVTLYVKGINQGSVMHPFCKTGHFGSMKLISVCLFKGFNVGFPINMPLLQH